MSGYSDGVRVEHAVMHHLIDNGYECTRAASSKGFCACGCGGTPSTPQTLYILGHRPLRANKLYLWERIEIDTRTSCLIWVGPRFPNGYGQATRGYRTHMAHRLSYETFVGPIPDGLVLDHLCRNRACVNPDHLEPVTQRENVRRAPANHAPRRAEALGRPCPNGHPRTPELTKVVNGTLNCKQCGREASLRHYHRRKGTLT